MNKDAGIIDVFQLHEGRKWKKSIRQAEPEAIDGLEMDLGIVFPEPFRQLYLYSNGGTLDGGPVCIGFFNLTDMKEFNRDPDWSPALPGMVLFGDDFGDYLFYFDADNRLGQGPWSVYAVEKGSIGFEYSVYLAPSLETMVQEIVKGEDLLDGMFLKDDPRFINSGISQP